MIAQAFTENGATVFISSRDAKQCEAAAAQLTANHGPGKCVALPADLSKVAGCIELAGKLRAALIELRGADKPASLDILVNNSGCSWGEPLEEYQGSIRVEASMAGGGRAGAAALTLLAASQRRAGTRSWTST